MRSASPDRLERCIEGATPHLTSDKVGGAKANDKARLTPDARSVIKFQCD